MPKMQDNNQKVDTTLHNPTANLRERGGIMPPHLPGPVPGSVPCQPPAKPTVFVQGTDLDLKIKVLATNIAETYIPLDLSKNIGITETDLINLADTAYIYIDNNGKPVKILASTVLRTEISWDDLAEATKQKIYQLLDAQKLTAGDNITIDENNIISADVGVKSINGRKDDVILTAADLNVYTIDDTYNKTEVYNKTEINQAFAEMIVDGGRVGESNE